jgi:rSAM/selenodomain-associated transferase 1
MNKKRNLVIIFAKDPVAGRVKTRLAKETGKRQALKVYESLLKKTFKTFKKTKYDVRVYFTPGRDNLKKLLPKRFELFPQKGRGLGSRMFNAFKDCFKYYQKIILIGVDCPFVNKGLIQKAFASLSQHSIIFGPSKDGGYYLVGLSKLYPSIFKNISWGSNKVLKQTLKQCKLLSIKPYLLKKLYDIDTVSDYKKWRSKK